LEIKPGEIYYVTIDPKHTVGREQHTRRPFVIVSRLRINRVGSVVVGVPFTTTGTDRPTHPPHRILIPASEISRDVSFVGTIHNSIALTDQVRALDPSRLEDKMGVVSATALASIGLGLSYLFDLR
jgi:mRNA-degrading endonuclease toxin of MazEF toxin-antitoxin module